MSNSTNTKRILLVDDNKDMTILLSKLLEYYGYSVKVANDGMTALEIAREFKPEIVLLDIGMPVMDGYETSRLLLSQKNKEDKMVLVAISGYGQEEDFNKSKEAGFSYHLVKPVGIDELVKVIENISF